MEIGTSFRGIYNLVPPPGATVSGFGFKKLKRGIKKAGRGVKKGVKKTGKVAVKIHTAPVKLAAKAGKFAMKRVAKLAAKPIIKVVNNLAGRRAKYIAFQKTGSVVTTLADKKAGGQYALGKIKKAGPLGKLAVEILKFTGGVTSGAEGDVLGGKITMDTSGWTKNLDMVGMTGVEIAAAAMSIVASVKGVMKTLNKPGEAPSDPEAAAKEPQPTESTQPVIESDDDKGSATTEETSTEEASTEETPAEETSTEKEAEDAQSETEGEALSLEAQIEMAQMRGDRQALKRLSAKWRLQHGAKWGQ
jgi:hypothetical protein